jgi:hypothetical protein
MNLQLTCIEVSIREEGYAVINLQASNVETAFYASGNIGFTCELADAERFEVGKQYGLDLQPIE